MIQMDLRIKRYGDNGPQQMYGLFLNNAKVLEQGPENSTEVYYHVGTTNNLPSQALTLQDAIDYHILTYKPGLISAYNSSFGTSETTADVKNYQYIWSSDRLLDLANAADSAAARAVIGATNFSGAYSDLSGKPTIPSISAQAHVNDAAANAATNAPTNLNVLTTLLGSLTGEVNATNTKQNDLATKYNDLATKFNTLLDRLEANSLLAAS